MFDLFKQISKKVSKSLKLYLCLLLIFYLNICPGLRRRPCRPAYLLQGPEGGQGSAGSDVPQRAAAATRERIRRRCHRLHQEEARAENKVSLPGPIFLIHSL